MNRRIVCLSAPWLLYVGIAFGARLTIETQPACATVTVDGRYVGLSPVTVDGLAPGDHALVVELLGYRTHRAVIAVAGDQHTVQLTLKADAYGSLTVISDPVGASVLVDGEIRGRTPLHLERLPARAYVIGLERDDYISWRGSVTVTPGQTVTVERALEPRTVEYYRAELKREPFRVVHYTDLAHILMVLKRYDEALQVLADGLQAAAGPRADAEDIRRIYDEVEKIYEGQYDFGGDEAVQQVRPKLTATLQRAIEQHPENAHNYRALASIYTREKRDDEALALYQQAWERVTDIEYKLQLGYQIGLTLTRLAQKREKARDYRGALEQYRQLVERFPDSYYAQRAMLNMASLYQTRLKDIDQCLALKRRYVEMHAKSDSAPSQLYSIAQLLERTKKDYPAAIETYRELIRRYPDYDSVYSARISIAGIYARELKDPEKALAEYQRVLDDYPQLYDTAATVLRSMASIYAQQGDVEKAEQLNRRILTKYPATTSAHYIQRTLYQRRISAQKRARILLAQRAKRRKSSPKSKRNIKLPPPPQVPEPTPEALRYTQCYQAYVEARKPLKDKDYRAAVAAFRKVSDDYPDQYYGRSSLSQAISYADTQLKDWRLANELRRLYIKRYPKAESCPQMLYEIGYSLRRHKRYKECVAVYREYLKTYPHSDRCAYIQYRIGSIYHSYLTDYHAAIREYETLVKRYPHYTYTPMALTYIGLCHQYLDDVEGARRAYELVLKTYPNSSGAYYAWRYLRRLPRR